jgi:hypothetical protein
MDAGAGGVGDRAKKKEGGGTPQATRRRFTPDLPTIFPRAGEKGVGKAGKPLHFKGSTFHRVINE